MFDTDLIKEAFLEQFKHGCNSFECTNKYCHSCKNFCYSSLKQSELDDLADSLSFLPNCFTMICKNLSPHLIYPIIFEDIIAFNDFVDCIIKSRCPNNISKINSILSTPSRYYLFTTDHLVPFTPDNIFIDKELIRDFLANIEGKNKIFMMIQDSFTNFINFLTIDPQSKSLHNTRAIYTIFLFPSFLIQHDTIIFIRLLQHIISFSPPQLKLFVQLFSTSELVIKKTNEMIQDSINKGHGISECINFISKVLYPANEVQYQSIPYQLFSNKHITDGMDLKEELQKYSHGEPSIFNLPMIVPLSEKLKFIKEEADYRDSLGLNYARTHHGQRDDQLKLFFSINVRRDHLLDDTFEALLTADPEDLHKKLMVTFTGEQAIDRGGVSREFFTQVTNVIFSPDYGMFEPIRNFYWFRGTDDTAQMLQYYKMLGTFVGVAIVNTAILPLHFPMVVYKKLLGKPLGLKDFSEIDPVSANSLKNLLQMKKDGEDIEDLCLMFDITEEVFGENKTVELISGGSQIPVTNDNIENYVNLYIEWKLEKSIEKQFNAFKEGYDIVCDNLIMHTLHHEELDELVSGLNEFNWNELKESAIYSNGYDQNHKTIVLFWKVFDEWDEKQKINFLYFVTGAKTAPVGGLKNLHIKLSKSNDVKLLPVSHTCFNQLVLPDYKNLNKIRKSLNICLSNSEGFGIQ